MKRGHAARATSGAPYATALRLALLFAAPGACGPGASPIEDSGAPTPRCSVADFEPAPTPQAIATLGFDGAGRTASVVVPAGSHFISARMTTPSRCAQVDALTLADGQALVTPGDFGPFCVRCVERSSQLVGAGLFALPSGPDAFALSATLSLALRDCALALGLRPLPVGERVELGIVSAQEHPLPRRGLLPLSVTASPGSWLARASAAQLRGFEQEVTRSLGDAALSVRVEARCVVPSAPSELGLTAGSHAPLVDVARAAASACPQERAEGRVRVWAVRCLTVEDAVLHARSHPLGYATHVPGGGGADAVADGVVVSDGCEGLGDGAAAPPPLARALAHEIGHYLGLYHTVEVDGREDLLADTDAANLLNASPELATSRGLSPSQVRIARRHPAIRWPIEGRARCAEP